MRLFRLGSEVLFLSLVFCGAKAPQKTRETNFETALDGTGVVQGYRQNLTAEDAESFALSASSTVKMYDPLCQVTCCVALAQHLFIEFAHTGFWYLVYKDDFFGQPEAGKRAAQVLP